MSLNTHAATGLDERKDVTAEKRRERDRTCIRVFAWEVTRSKWNRKPSGLEPTITIMCEPNLHYVHCLLSIPGIFETNCRRGKTCQRLSQHYFVLSCVRSTRTKSVWDTNWIQISGIMMKRNYSKPSASPFFLICKSFYNFSRILK